MINHTLGDTIRFKIKFYDANSALFNPTSPGGKIYDSSSTVVASMNSLTNISTGVYLYEWQTIVGSHGLGTGALEISATASGYTYKKREILFKIV